MSMRWPFFIVGALLGACAPQDETGEAPPDLTAFPLGKLVPKHGVLLGAYVDPNATWDGNAKQELEVENFESLVGRSIDIDHHYYAWSDTFPSELEHWD